MLGVVVIVDRSEVRNLNPSRDLRLQAPQSPPFDPHIPARASEDAGCGEVHCHSSVATIT